MLMRHTRKTNRHPSIHTHTHTHTYIRASQPTDPNPNPYTHTGYLYLTHTHTHTHTQGSLMLKAHVGPAPAVTERCLCPSLTGREETASVSETAGLLTPDSHTCLHTHTRTHSHTHID